MRTTPGHGNMPNISKKRKSSEPQNGATPRKKSKAKGDYVSSGGTLFTTESPLVRTPAADDDVFTGTQQLTAEFEFNFAVRPGARWEQMRSYRNVKYSENTFANGGFVYINKTIPPPKPPSPDATDEEILAYDRANLWVGIIADTRAASDREVFLRIFWLYWPEELPMGRQPYHSDRELIMSNAMEIIDATTISSAANVTHWDEKDLDADFGERFWRQTFDIGQLGKNRKGGLSVLKGHCRCQQPSNPDNIMYLCKDPSCGTWNHQQCLIDDIHERGQKMYENGTIDELDITRIKSDLDEKPTAAENGDSILSKMGKFVSDKIKPAVNVVADQSVLHETHKPESKESTRSPQQRKHPTKSETPSGIPRSVKNKLRVTILDSESTTDDEPVRAIIEELVSEPTQKGRKKENIAQTWTTYVSCLQCGRTMD